MLPEPVIDPTIQNVTGKFLTDAVNWFKENDIPLYGIARGRAYRALGLIIDQLKKNECK